MPFNNPSSRRILTAALLSALLISALAATLFIGNVTANPIMPDPEAVYIKVQSPTSKVYNTAEVSLQFYATIGYSNAHPVNPWFYGKVLSVRYWLDGKLVGQHDGEDLPKSYSVALTGLSDGEHIVQVSMNVHCYQRFRMLLGNGSYHVMYTLDEHLSGSKTVSFTVETQPPSIRVIPSRKTFETSSSTADVPLNFTVNESVSWIGYSLNGKNVVTVTNHVTSTEWIGVDNYQLVLRGLHAGAHTLTVYAEDLGGNRGASEPFSFTVTQETPSETEQASTLFSTSSTAVASAIIASAAAISSGLAAYFVRVKRKKGEA